MYLFLDARERWTTSLSGVIAAKTRIVLSQNKKSVEALTRPIYRAYVHSEHGFGRSEEVVTGTKARLRISNFRASAVARA